VYTENNNGIDSGIIVDYLMKINDLRVYSIGGSGGRLEKIS
jgi:hypothetical protein